MRYTLHLLYTYRVPNALRAIMSLSILLYSILFFWNETSVLVFQIRPGISPPTPPPFTSSRRRAFLRPAEDFFFGPSKEEAELGAKWGEGTDCFVSCACEVGKSTGVCRRRGGVAVTTLGLADRTLEEKEKKDFPSWYRVTHPPDENGMLKQIVGPKKKVWRKGKTW